MHQTDSEAVTHLEIKTISLSLMSQNMIFGCWLRQYYNICRFVDDVSSEQTLEPRPGTHHIRQEVVADGPREPTNQTIYTMVIFAGPHNNQLPSFDHAVLILSRAS
jgi:hypothetical protein